MNYTKDAYDSNGAWAVVTLNAHVLSYNPKAMAANNLPIPNSWLDLANPVYKGKIAFPPPSLLTGAGQLLYYLYKQLGNTTWTQLMKNMAANEPTLQPLSVSDIASGKFTLTISTYTDCQNAKVQAPDSVTCKALNPSIYNPAAVSLLKNGPHPQMARLFEDWLLSQSGQLAVTSYKQVPYQTSIATAFGANPPGVTLVNGLSDLTPLQNSAKWTAIFKSIFGPNG